MKNKIIFFTVPAVLMILISAFIPKPKNDNVGGIIGRMILEITNDWQATPQNSFKAGRYYDLTIIVEGKNSRKRIRIKADKNGYFSLLNLSPGVYEITECNLEDYPQNNYIWTMPHILKKAYNQENKENYNEKIKRKYGFIMVNEKQLTVLNTLIILNTFTRTYSHNAYSSIKYEIDYDYDSIINNFKEKDKKNYWADFTLFKHDEEKQD